MVSVSLRFAEFVLLKLNLQFKQIFDIFLLDKRKGLIALKFCPKCKRLDEKSAGSCEHCNRETTQIKDKGTPVFLLSTGGIDRNRITAALSDVKIPFIEQKHKKAGDAESVLGAGAVDVDILVPFAVYEQAYDICVGIGAITPNASEESTDSDSEYEDHTADSVAQKIEEMSPAKRTTWRIISAILLIIVFSAVILGTDYIMALIKNMFT